MCLDLLKVHIQKKRVGFSFDLLKFFPSLFLISLPNCILTNLSYLNKLHIFFC